MERVLQSHLLETAESLIRKHLAHLDRTFFNHPTTLEDALYHVELGLSRTTMPFERSLDRCTSPAEIQPLFAQAIEDGIAYHRRVCGTPSYDNPKVILGCPRPPCTVTLAAVQSANLATLTPTEAELLFALFKNPIGRNSQAPYTAANLLKLATIL